MNVKNYLSKNFECIQVDFRPCYHFESKLRILFIYRVDSTPVSIVAYGPFVLLYMMNLRDIWQNYFLQLFVACFTEEMYIYGFISFSSNFLVNSSHTSFEGQSFQQ